MSLLLLSTDEKEGAKADSRQIVTAPKSTKLRRFAVRRHERVPVEYTGMIHWKGPGGNYEYANGFTIDISTGGVALASDRVVSSSSVFVCIPGLSFASYADVRRTINCGSGCVVGLEFRDRQYNEQRAAAQKLLAAPGLQALADEIDSFVVSAITSLPAPGSAPGSALVLPDRTGRAGPLCVDSEISGDIEVSGERLVIGSTTHVKAKVVQAQEVIICGSLEGDVNGPERVELRRGGRLIGNVRTAVFVMEPGAYFEGRVEPPNA